MDMAPGLYCRQSINDSPLYLGMPRSKMRHKVKEYASSPTTGVTPALGAFSSNKLIAHSLGTQLNTLVNSRSSKPRTLSHH